jgi:ABC-type transporter Mla MlaB component
MTAPDGTWMSLSPGIEQDVLAGEQDLARGPNVDLRAGEWAVSGNGTLRIARTGSPLGLVITGEIDESTYSGLVRALEGLTAAPGEIHVDLTGLLYCDIAGLRAIVDLTGARCRSSRAGSRRVVLHEVPPQLRAALRIVGWDSTPGLVLHEREGSNLSPPGGVAQGATQARQLGEPHVGTLGHLAGIPAIP